MPDAPVPSAPATAAPSPAPLPAAKPGATIIKVPMGGSFSMNALSKAVGQKGVDDDTAEEDAADEADAKESKKQASDAEGEEAAEEDEAAGDEDSEEDPKEDAEDTEEKDAEEDKEPDADSPKFKGKTARVVLPDGTEQRISLDAKVHKKVDGEWQEISLGDALNREVGELTVEQRLSKLANFEHTLKKEVETVKSQWAAQETAVKDIAKLAQGDKPELALAKIGELQGIPPGDVMRKLFREGLKWSKQFWEEGKGDIVKMDAYFDRMNSEFHAKRYEDSQKQSTRQREDAEFIQFADAAMSGENLSQDEFTSTMEELLNEKAFVGKSNKQVVDAICERALLRKHTVMVDEALESVDPALLRDNKFRQVLLNTTDPHNWTPDELKALVKDYKRESYAAKLNRAAASNGATPRQNVAAKQKTEKPKMTKVRSASDLKRLFGIHS